METQKKRQRKQKTPQATRGRKKKTEPAPVPAVSAPETEQVGKMTPVPPATSSDLPDRRQNPRIHFETLADLKFTDCSVDRLLTRDLSTNGAFLLNLKNKKIGEECEVTLHCDLVLKMKAEVVRIEEEGTAIQFFDQDLDNYHHLKNVVYINAVRREDIDYLKQIEAENLPMEKLEGIGMLEDLFSDDEDYTDDNDNPVDSWDSDD